MDRRVEAYALICRAIDIQLSGKTEVPLQTAEDCLLRAIALNPQSLEALEELAHLYDAVLPNPPKAKSHALKCKERAEKIVLEMNEILADPD